MDLHKQLRESITDKDSRDAALAFLRSIYSEAAKSSEWEDVVEGAKRKQGWYEINWDDPLRLYEVESRPVGVVYPANGPGHAWVWTDRWFYAPALAPKASIEGAPYSPRVFATEFPGADLIALEALARGVLGYLPTNDAHLLTPPAAEIEDRDLIQAGYALTKLFMARQPEPFLSIAPRVIAGLNADLADVLPLIGHWYDFARYELDEPPNTDTPYRVSQSLQELAKRLAEESESAVDPVEEFLWMLPKAIRNFAKEKAEELARTIRYRLRRMKPSGIFDNDARNLWDEYSLQVQSGPIELESAWDATVDPMILFEVQKLAPEEAALMTLSHQWWEDELTDELSADVIDEEAIGATVRSALNVLADQNEQHWVTG